MSREMLHNSVKYAIRQDALEAAIDEEFSHFDFDKVRRVMEFLEWGWGYNPSVVPTTRTMKEFVKNELILSKFERRGEYAAPNHVNEDGYFFSSSGGFHVSGRIDNNRMEWLHIGFEIEDTDAYNIPLVTVDVTEPEKFDEELFTL